MDVYFYSYLISPSPGNSAGYQASTQFHVKKHHMTYQLIHFINTRKSDGFEMACLRIVHSCNIQALADITYRYMAGTYWEQNAECIRMKE